MSLPETGYGFTVSAKLFGISVNRIVSNSYKHHKIFIRGRSQVEKPCKIIIIILILSPENRYMTRTNSYWYIYYKRKNYYKRLLESFVGPGRWTRLLLDHHLHLRLLFPFHFLLLFFPSLFRMHPFRLLPVGRFFVDVNDLLIGGLTAAVFLLRHQVIGDVVGIKNDTLDQLAHLKEGPADLGNLCE